MAATSIALSALFVLASWLLFPAVFDQHFDYVLTMSFWAGVFTAAAIEGQKYRAGRKVDGVDGADAEAG